MTRVSISQAFRFRMAALNSTMSSRLSRVAQPMYGWRLRLMVFRFPRGSATIPFRPGSDQPATVLWTAPAGLYIYRTTFSLAGLNPTTANIVGQWAADNSGTNILINGVAVGATSGGFGAFSAFSISSGFVAGLNTLDFLVNNLSGPTALRVEMTGTASPISAAIPEPASLFLVGAGMIVVGLRRRRRAGVA